MRCFIGLPVVAALGDVLHSLPRPAGGRPVPVADLHLTLAFLGDRDRAWTETLWPALGALAATTPTFAVTLTAAHWFPGPRGRIWAAWVAPSEGLRALHGAVWERLREAGLEGDDEESEEKRDFLPHVTLARLPRRTRMQPVAGPWLLPVDELMLYQSPPERDGYRALKRWPLK